MAQGFRGFIPWTAGSIVYGCVKAKISWWKGVVKESHSIYDSQEVEERGQEEGLEASYSSQGHTPVT